MLYKKGGLREIFDVGIEYLTNALAEMELEESSKSEIIKQRAEEKLKELHYLKAKYALVLKRLCVLEDKELISVLFEADRDGDYFAFDKVCFIKIEKKEALEKVSQILGKKYYLEVSDGQYRKASVKEE